MSGHGNEDGVLTAPRAARLLADGFSPWVADLDLTFEAIGADHAVLRMPFDVRLCRQGGIVGGQALMALADTAAVFGMWAAAGSPRPCTTVDVAVQMMRPVSDADVLATATTLRIGRTTAFVGVLMHADGDDRPVVNAQVTLALLD